MTKTNPSWKDLHFYQKVKYAVEILAICGGMLLVGINIYQVRMLSQSNEINRRVFDSTFPMEIQSDLVKVVDRIPLVIKLRLTNIVGRRLQLRPWTPRLIRIGSEVIDPSRAEITIHLIKQKEISAALRTGGAEKSVVLKPSESCILEISITSDIRSENSRNDVFKQEPYKRAFFIIPLSIESFGQAASKIIFVSLWRDKRGTLPVTSDVLRYMDDQTLMELVRLERLRIIEPPGDFFAK